MLALNEAANVLLEPPNSISNSAVQSAWWLDLAKSIVAPAVVAVFFTGITNYALELAKGKREALTGLSSALRDELKQLQDLGTEYWSVGRCKDDTIRAAKIMASLEAISTGLRGFSALQGFSFENPSIDAWLISVRDHLTGGDFQTSARVADHGRVQAAASEISKMRYRVFGERLKRM